MSVKDQIAAICRIDAQVAALNEQREQLRQQLLTRALAEYEEQGAAPTWRAPLGTVYLTVKQPKPHVVNDREFESFVGDRYGDEAFVTVRRVRNEAAEALFAECQVVESVCALVTPEGEPVPGVVVKVPPPTLTVRLTPEAKLGAQIDLAAVAESEAVG